MEGFGRLLGASWTALGRSWRPLGLSWDPLGRILGASLALLGASWPPSAAQDGLGLDFHQFWLDLESVWGSILGPRQGFGKAVGIQPLDLHDALFSAGNPC